MLEGVSLRKQLAISFALIAAVFGLIFGTLGVTWVERESASRITTVLAATANQGQQTLAAALREAQINLVMATAGMADRTPAGLLRAGNAWIDVISQSHAYRWEALLTPQGQVLATSPNGPAVGSSVASQPWFAVSGPFGAVRDGTGSTVGVVDQGASVIATAPVLGANGQLQAVLVSLLGTESFSRLVALITPRTSGQVPPEVMLVNGRGEVLASSSQTRPAVIPRALLADAGPPLIRDLEWDDGNSYMTAVSAPVNAGTGDVNWRVVVRRPTSAATATASALESRVLEVDAVIVLVAAILGFFIAHGLTNPLRKIARAADSIRGGALDVTIPPARFTREMAQLSASLGAMVASLRAHEGDLAKLNRDLEDRFTQRTAELAQNERRLRAVIETTIDGVMIIDRQARIEVFNQACERLYGWRAEEVIGNPITLLITEDERVQLLARLDGLAQMQSADEQIGITFEMQAVRRDGSHFKAQVSLSRSLIGETRFHVAIVRDITKEVQAREELFAYATLDALTGLRNRRHFLEGTETEFARARRQNRSLTFLTIDADHFKRVNDVYGHAMGDAVLRTLADLCKRNVREVDLVGRLGGEEFAIAMPEADIDLAIRVAERLRLAVAECVVVVEGVEVTLTISIGVAALADQDATLAGLMARADAALYEAKRTGRDKVVSASSVRAIVG